MSMSTEELVKAEAVIKQELDQRAADQTAAMEAALVAGTLPEEDRRADLAAAHDALAAEYFAMVAALLPPGSKVEHSDGVYRVTRGGGNALVGEGPTLSRAVLLINAGWSHDETGARVLLSESGEVIPPL